MKPITMQAGGNLKGFYRVQVVNTETGKTTKDTGWFENVVTNYALDTICSSFYGARGFFTHCALGTSTTPPAITDVALGAQYSSRSGWIDQDYTFNSGSPNYYVSMVRRYVFGQGHIVGNMTEVGIFAGGSGANCMSHALLKDGAGNPTTLTVLPIEQIYVTYEIRHYPILTDDTGSIVISGTTYNYTYRMTGIYGDQGFWWSYGLAFQNAQLRQMASYDVNTPFALTDNPNYSFGLPTLNTPAAYVNGTYYTESTFVWGINEGNWGGGMGSIVINNDHTNNRSQRHGFYFTPKFDKTATKNLTLTVRVTLGRL